MGGRGLLGEAGVGAAGVAVLPLPALHHAGDLQPGLHREGPVPDLQGAAEDRRGRGYAGSSFFFFFFSRTHTDRYCVR